MNIIFKIIIKPILSILMMYSVLAGCGSKNTNLKYKIICIDPGHGGTANSDSFRIGPTGEREEWIRWHCYGKKIITGLFRFSIWATKIPYKNHSICLPARSGHSRIPG